MRLLIMAAGAGAPESDCHNSLHDDIERVLGFASAPGFLAAENPARTVRCIKRPCLSADFSGYWITCSRSMQNYAEEILTGTKVGL